jgi:hypothetical protein
MVTVRSSETSVNFHQTTQRHIPKDSTLLSHRQHEGAIEMPETNHTRIVCPSPGYEPGIPLIEDKYVNAEPRCLVPAVW